MSEDWETEIVGYFDRIDAAVGGQDLGMSLVDVWMFTAAQYAFIGGLLVLSGGVYAVAWNSELHSFWNLLALAVSPGIFFFALAPAVIKFGHRHSRLVSFGGGLLSAGLLVVAKTCGQLFPTLEHESCQFLQATLIEFAVALLMLAALEVALAPKRKALEAKLQAAREQNAAAKREIAAWRERRKKGIAWSQA